MKGSGKRSGKNASPTRPSEANISDTISDIIYKFGTEQINQKLCEKEESGYQSNITE